MSRHEHILTRYGGESYYGQAPLKTPQWDWKVSGYIAIVGTAGAAQARAFLGGLRDPEAFRPARRTARLLALSGSAIGSALLIADLKTPKRFYNMLRILRPTSPMSIGTYILGAFGVASAVEALGALPAAQRRPWLRRLSNSGQAVAALSGAGAATYTAGLLSATSAPYWAAAPGALGAQFATSSVAGGAAALALAERAGGRGDTAGRLEAVAAAATLAHLGASEWAERRQADSGVSRAMGAHATKRELRAFDLLLAGAAPLAGYALNRVAGGRAPVAAVAGSLAVLAGSWLVRDAILRAGKASATRPEVAFGFAQPRNLPPRERHRAIGGHP